MQYDSNNALLKTEMNGIPAPFRGKVRDVYDMGDSMLFVATDRISAFDCIMPNGVPDKGKVLTQLSLFWLEMFREMPNHLITADVSKYPAPLKPYLADLDGRSMLVKKLKMLPVECVVRGYLSGSGWKDYEASRTVSGIRLRDGYENCGKLDEPIFTPSSKESKGHDLPVSFDELSRRIGSELAAKLRDCSINIYSKAADYALSKGIVIADTKFEFGLDADGTLTLADEVLTPDSSRFWPLESYRPGANPPSLDKQFVRDWLDSVGFNRQPPAPELPKDIVMKTREKYLGALKTLAGK